MSNQDDKRFLGSTQITEAELNLKGLEPSDEWYIQAASGYALWASGWSLIGLREPQKNYKPLHWRLSCSINYDSGDVSTLKMSSADLGPDRHYNLPSEFLFLHSKKCTRYIDRDGERALDFYNDEGFVELVAFHSLQSSNALDADCIEYFNEQAFYPEWAKGNFEGEYNGFVAYILNRLIRSLGKGLRLLPLGIDSRAPINITGETAASLDPDTINKMKDALRSYINQDLEIYVVRKLSEGEGKAFIQELPPRLKGWLKALTNQH